MQSLLSLQKRALYRLALLCLLSVIHGLAIAEDQLLDLRIIVDVSGSMKKNDPYNLRQPAVRMLAGLIPENSRSGVWTFAASTNMLIGYGSVHDTWRNTARSKSRQIMSPGLYTDIEDALRVATADWVDKQPDVNRQVILLTDGKIDIKKGKGSHQQSRERILDEVLPRLEKAGARVHTVSLSDNTDERLMQALAAATDGMFLKAKTAEDLQKLFTYLWQKTTDTETISIYGRKFHVDDHMKEVTVLIMHENNQPVELISPVGENISSEAKQKNVKWFRDQNYSLITLINPEKGLWTVKGSDNRDNHVLIISDLRLRVEVFPTNILVGDVININAILENRGEVIRDRTITDGMDISLTIRSLGGGNSEYRLPKANQQGVFVQQHTFNSKGDYEIRVVARGRTFTREYQDYIKVQEKVADAYVSRNNDSELEIKVRPKLKMLHADSIEMEAELANGEKRAMNREQNNWSLKLPDSYANQKVKMNVKGTTQRGKKFTAKGELLVRENQEEDISLEQEAEPETDEKSMTRSEIVQQPAEEAVSEKNATGINWLMAGGFTGLFLVLLGAGVAGGITYYRKRTSALVDDIWSEAEE